MPFCPKCGKENPEGARFCMHCGADLSGYKVEISPKIDVGPKIEVKPGILAKPITPSAETCALCETRRATVTCKQCGRKVCNYHYEDYWGTCTKCAIAELENRAAFLRVYNEDASELDHKIENLKKKI
jgi:hypothetical protein